MADDLEAHLEGLGRHSDDHLRKLLGNVLAVLPVYSDPPGNRLLIGYSGTFPYREGHLEIKAVRSGKASDLRYDGKITFFKPSGDERWDLPSPVGIFFELEGRYEQQQSNFLTY